MLEGPPGKLGRFEGFARLMSTLCKIACLADASSMPTMRIWTIAISKPSGLQAGVSV
ncbi:hypothetical protein X767_13145 [Mesorhizobium sp. LSJC264A00]|nr:hypothetical protein X767_13145 [Mesorhizobium sp. LSJC264A00]